MEIAPTTTGTSCVDTGQQQQQVVYHQHQKATKVVVSPLGNGHFENWGDSAMADNSQQTDTSTDVDTDDKNHVSKPLSFSPVFKYTLILIPV